MAQESFNTRPLDEWPDNHKMVATQTVEEVIALPKIVRINGGSRGDLLWLTFVTDLTANHGEVVRAFGIAYDAAENQGAEFTPSASDLAIALVDEKISRSIVLFDRKEYEAS